MPSLKNRRLFISHAWQYSEHYQKLVSWFKAEPNFSWSNCSVPSHDGLPDKTVPRLKAGITRQINPCQVVIILGGMYAAHSEWIEYEIDEAVRMKKSIIGVRPWNQQRVPLVVQNASTIPVVGWKRARIIGAIRQLT